MVKPLTLDQAHATLDRLGKGYHMIHMYPNPSKPEIEGIGWYIRKDISSVLLSGDCVSSSDELIYSQLFDQSGVCVLAKYLDRHGINTEMYCHCSKDVDFQCTAIKSLEALVEHIHTSKWVV